MGGINIHCGTFSGRDQSGSAFEGVLAAVKPIADGWARAAIERIESELMLASNFILISPADATVLFPLIQRYKAVLERDLGQARTLDELLRHDEEITGLDATEAKAGKGIGWQYYCVVDLERAFAVAGLQSRNVALSW